MSGIYTSKMPSGAVRSGQTIEIQLHGSDLNDIAVIVKKDGETSYEYLPMYCSGNNLYLSYKFDIPGLYFYSFFSPKSGYLHFDNFQFIGFAHAEYWFQQTVYSNSYKASEQFRGSIAYQIFPDRFYRVEPVEHIAGRVYHEDVNEMPIWWPDKTGVVRNNDFYGGSLKGIEAKLPYLKSLNVSLIYLNPIFLAYSNHRYDTSDYMTIDPQLGTKDDFISLCKTAKESGIKIILDGVFSHTGDNSIYFNKYGVFDSVGAYQSKESPYYDWYNFKNWPNIYASWWGFDTLPEVNELVPSYVEFITGTGGVVEYWMSLGAAGFRLDVADELPDEFIIKIKEAIRRCDPEGLLIGEVWEDASNKISYSVRRKYFLGNELDGTMNYPFRTAVLDFVSNGDSQVFKSKIESILWNYPKEMLSTCLNLLTSHDTPRAINMLVDSFAASRSKQEAANKVLSRSDYLRGIEMMKLAYALLFYLPGIPTIYYGDEIGMQGYGDPFCRYYFKWDSIDENLLEFVKELSNEHERWRHVFREGRMEFFEASRSVLGFWRKSDDGKIAFILNRSDHDYTYIFDNGKVVTVGPWKYKSIYFE